MDIRFPHISRVVDLPPDQAQAAFIAARTSAVALADGTRLVLRPLVPEDKDLLVQAFEQLSPESRYRRFFAPMSRLSASLLAYLTELDYVDHFAWVALTEENGRAVPLGVARYVRLPDPSAAEAAVTVIDPYQGRGIGSLLLDALVLEALENGIARFEGFLLVDNMPMLAVLRRAGARVSHDGAATLRFELNLPARREELRSSPIYEVLRALAQGEAQLYQREPCPWLSPSRAATETSGSPVGARPTARP